MFDIDGTLANTDPVHFAVFQELLLAEGVNGGVVIDEAFNARVLAGRSNPVIMGDLFPHWPLDRQLAWTEGKEKRFRALLAAGKLADAKTRGLDKLVAWVDAHRPGKTCAVTNAPRLNANAILSGIGLDSWFGDRLVIGDECARAKPDPLPYILGAERIGADPQRCIVFEDSPSGATAGKAAGCFVVGILSGQTREALEAVGCDLIVKDMECPVLWDFLEGAVGSGEGTE